MSTVLNWQLRNHLWRFREEAGDGSETRLPLLINLILHANVRGRAWPSRKTIARELGVREHTVTDALRWLFDHGAIYNVPFKYRVGAEAEMEPRKYVYQMTGVIRLADQLVPYLYLPDPEVDLARTLKELEELGGEALVKFLSQGSESEGSESEDKDSTDSQGGTPKDSNSPGSGELEPHMPYQLPPGIGAAPVAGEEIPTGEGQDDYDEHQWTLFEKWVMGACSVKTLSDAQRAAFHKKLPYLRDGEPATSPTVNEAYERWEEYRESVKDIRQDRHEAHQSSAHLTRGMLTLSTSPSTAGHSFTREDACPACLG